MGLPEFESGLRGPKPRVIPSYTTAPTSLNTYLLKLRLRISRLADTAPLDSRYFKLLLTHLSENPVERIMAFWLRPDVLASTESI